MKNLILLLLIIGACTLQAQTKLKIKNISVIVDGKESKSELYRLDIQNSSNDRVITFDKSIVLEVNEIDTNARFIVSCFKYNSKGDLKFYCTQVYLNNTDDETVVNPVLTSKEL